MIIKNIYIFYLPLFHSVAKKLFLGRKNIGGGATVPPCPLNNTYDKKYNKLHGMKNIQICFPQFSRGR
jgi:hypothetical protein